MIKWELDDVEANLVLNLVASGPYKDVHQVINKLQQQATQQINERSLQEQTPQTNDNTEENENGQ